MRVSHAVWWQGKVIVPAADEAWCVWSCVYMRACIHACVRACERACVRSCILHTCMNPCVHAFMLPCMHACSLSLSFSLSLTHTHTPHTRPFHIMVYNMTHTHTGTRCGWGGGRVRRIPTRTKRLCGHARAGIHIMPMSMYHLRYVGRSACVATRGPVFILCKCIICDM